jgi:hypothetical protein
VLEKDIGGHQLAHLDTVNGKYPERGVDITLTQTMLSSLLEHLEQLKNDHKSLKEDHTKLEVKVKGLKENLQPSWPIIRDIQKPHLIKGAAWVLYWGKKNKIAKHLTPFQVTFTDTLQDEFKTVLNITHEATVEKAINLYGIISKAYSPVKESMDEHVLKLVETRSPILRSLWHVNAIVETNYNETFAPSIIDDATFLTGLKRNVCSFSNLM